MTRHADRVRRLGLATRLFLGCLLIIVSGAGTVLVIALLTGPQIFDYHLGRAEISITPEVQTHVAEAFDQALITSLSAGVLLAVLVAAAISALVARRVAAPIHAVAEATRNLAEGRHDVHLHDPHLGPELTSLTTSTNHLARRLAITENDRRRLTAELAHQLRTPVASLEATTQALQDHILTPDPATLDVLADQAARLHRLVADLEKVTRAEERAVLITPQSQPLLPLLTRLVAAHQERYRAQQVTLTLQAHRPQARTPDVRIDPDRIHEALSNLLDNALRHTPPGGQVTIHFTATPRAATIAVKDTGTGFDPEHAEALFDRFHREPTTAPATGNGLGLTIARALVTAHHGTLTAHSDGPGRGATLTMTLPACS